MRNVLRNSVEVCHYWANQVQASGRSGNMSFEGPRLYSYRAEIARILPDGSVALSTERWSSTTSGHQSEARHASKHRTPIYVGVLGTVDDVFRWAERQRDSKLEEAVKPRKRPHTRAWAIQEAVSCIEQANRYAVAMGHTGRLPVPACSAEKLDEIKVLVAQQAEREKAEALRRLEEQKAKHKKDKVAWRKGKLAYYGLERNLLRLKDDVVQTSGGAEIPVTDAKKLWPIIERCRKGDKCFTPGAPVGVYQLTKVRSDGSIVVSCHDIPYVEIKQIAKKLALI